MTRNTQVLPVAIKGLRHRTSRLSFAEDAACSFTFEDGVADRAPGRGRRDERYDGRSVAAMDEVPRRVQDPSGPDVAAVVQALEGQEGHDRGEGELPQ